MDNTSTTLDALERTAAWVQQVQNHVEMMKNSPMDSDCHDDDMNFMNEEDIKKEASDRDDNSLTDHHDEALKNQAFAPYIPNQRKSASYEQIDIRSTVQEFKKALEKYGISQRFASNHIMENTSQGNLSFLLEKGKNKPWSEISPRGRIPYIRMRRWLDSPEEQKETMKQLYKTKDFKKGSNGTVAPKRDRREKFSLFQLLVLCRVYEEDSNPSLSTRTLLAEKLEAPVERITVWFQNQRARYFPAKRLLKESKMFKDNVSELSAKKGMKKSDTPLQDSTGSSSTFGANQGTSHSVNNKPSATITQEQEAQIQSCVNTILGTTIVPSLPTANSLVTNQAQMHQLAGFPIPLMNIAQVLKPGLQLPTSSSAEIQQQFAQYLGFQPQLFTVSQTTATNSATQALNLMKSQDPIIIKDEPCDLSAPPKSTN